KRAPLLERDGVRVWLRLGPAQLGAGACGRRNRRDRQPAVGDPSNQDSRFNSQCDCFDGTLTSISATSPTPTSSRPPTRRSHSRKLSRTSGRTWTAITTWAPCRKRVLRNLFS